MLINLVLALIIFFLSNTFTLVPAHPYVNFGIFAVIVFLILGAFTSPEPANRNRWIF